MLETLRAFKFLFIGPLILLMLFTINQLTGVGYQWWRWAALGIGLAWMFSLLRVIKAVIVAGGLAAFAAYLAKRNAAG